MDLADSAARTIAACAGLDLPATASKLGEDGLLGVLAPEDAGGLGLDLAAAVSVCQEAGAGLLAFPLIETMLAIRLLAPSQPDLARRLVQGDALITFATRGTLGARQTGNQVTVEGTVAGALLLSEWVLAGIPDGLVLLDVTDAATQDEASLDLERPRSTVTVSSESVPLDRIWTSADVRALRRAADLLQAADMLGAARFGLEQSVSYVATRRQFGRPLSSQQAIRHDLARHRLAVESLRRLVDHAARTGTDIDAAAAYAFAAEAAPRVAEAAIQMHGGMGFTWDLGLHRYARRIRAGLEGRGAASARAELAAAMLDG